MSAAESLPVGAILRSFYGAEWRKRSDGSFDVLSDPEWGPVWADDIPSGVTLVNWAKFTVEREVS